MHISIRSSLTLFVVFLLFGLLPGCQNGESQTSNTENSTEEKELTPEEIKQRDIELYASEFTTENGVRDRVLKYITHRYENFTPIEADETIIVKEEPITTINANDLFAFDTIISGNAIYNVDPSRNAFQKVSIETGGISSPVNTKSTGVLMGITERNGLITLCSSDKIFFYDTVTDSTTTIPNSYNLVYACSVGKTVFGTGGFGFPKDSPSNWFISYHSRETGALVEPDYIIDTTPIQEPRFTGKNRPTTTETLHFACSEEGIALCNYDNVNSVLFLQIDGDTIVAQKTIDISGALPDLSKNYTVDELEELASPPIITYSSLHKTKLTLVYGSLRLTQTQHYVIIRDITIDEKPVVYEIRLPEPENFVYPASRLIAYQFVSPSKFRLVTAASGLDQKKSNKSFYYFY